MTVEARERGADDAEGTLWLTVLAFGGVADELARHSAGDPVSVSGRLQLSRYVTNDGEAREGWQVIADSVVSSRSVRPGGGRRKGDGGEVRDRRERSPGEAVRRCLAVVKRSAPGRGVSLSVVAMSGMTFELDTPHGRMSGWGREAPKSVGSNGEPVFRLKGERAFEVDVWTFNRRCRLL